MERYSACSSPCLVGLFLRRLAHLGLVLSRHPVLRGSVVLSPSRPCGCCCCSSPSVGGSPFFFSRGDLGTLPCPSVVSAPGYLTWSVSAGLLIVGPHTVGLRSPGLSSLVSPKGAPGVFLLPWTFVWFAALRAKKKKKYIYIYIYTLLSFFCSCNVCSNTMPTNLDLFDCLFY